MAAEREPSFDKTYRRADGESIDNHGWVAHLEYFDEENEPVELIEETWERTAVRTYWHLPAVTYGCDVPDCYEDAVGWRRAGDGASWAQVCADHDGGTATRP